MIRSYLVKSLENYNQNRMQTIAHQIMLVDFMKFIKNLFPVEAILRLEQICLYNVVIISRPTECFGLAFTANKSFAVYNRLAAHYSLSSQVDFMASVDSKFHVT